MAGEVVDPLGGFQIRPADGFAELEISRASADEGGHVAPGSEKCAEIVTVGADIETFGAVNFESDGGEGDLEDLIFVDANAAGRTIDRLALSSQFVEGDAIFFDSGDHGRDLIKLPGKLFEGGLNGGGVERGDGAGLEHFSGRVLGIGGFAEFESSFVLLVFGHEQVLDAGGSTDDEHEEAGGDRVERATVANFALMEAAADEVDDVVGGAAGRFIDQEQAVELRDHRFGLEPKVREKEW